MTTQHQPTGPAQPLLHIEDLAVYYDIGQGAVKAVDGISFDLAPGEALGLVGESGCGKTTTAKGVLRLLPPNGRIAQGNIHFNGRNLVQLSPEAMRQTRWRDISWISQAAMNALDPVYRVGDQIVEAMQAHISISKQAALEHAADLFREVGIDPKRLRAYPHEMSGGMRQRAIIAMALALEPQLIIADEPTTALDVVTQAQILARLQRLRQERGLALMLITHDISVVVQTCDTVAVMYAGQIMERGPVRPLFKQPYHPYTMGLRNAFPTLEGARQELISIPGSPPDLVVPPGGCRFADRCPFVEERCREEAPPLLEVEDGRFSACHFPERAEEFRKLASQETSWQQVAQRLGTSITPIPKQEQPAEKPILIEVKNLVRHFPVGQSWLVSLLGRTPQQVVHAVDGISFDVKQGEILGLAGESGSGKTTTGETLVRLQDPTDGQIVFDGQAIEGLHGRDLKQFRRQAQMVFQDPYETLNPRFMIGDIVSEPLRIHGLARGEELRRYVIEALERAGLRPAELYLDRFPHELSGGQRQRVAIARAIVLEPKFLVADEPVSMLDVSIRAGVLNLLRRFRDELGLSIIYVSHDLPTIRYVADRTAIMYLGEIVEIGPTETLIAERKHPYTQLLLDASPDPDPDVIKPPLEARGEIPSAIEPPHGCRFHTRCPLVLPHCGWEGRDVINAVTAVRIEGDGLTAVGDIEIEGLDALVSAPQGLDPARVALETALAAKHESLLQAAEINHEGERLRVHFKPQPGPRLEPVAGDHYSVFSEQHSVDSKQSISLPMAEHAVACWLYTELPEKARNQ
jgi:peptide/nickel transport system ATP-binding protein